MILSSSTSTQPNCEEATIDLELKDPYLYTEDEVDLDREERNIQKFTSLALLLSAALFAAGFYTIPGVVDFPTALLDRIAFAIQAGVFVMIWVFIAVGMVSVGRRKSAADVQGSAAGPPSPKIAIHVAFLQNTLEQAVLTVFAFVAFAVAIEGPGLSMIVVAVAIFAIGRLLFLKGYRKGASGRAFGMALTMTPSIFGYPAAIILMF